MSRFESSTTPNEEELKQVETREAQSDTAVESGEAEEYSLEQLRSEGSQARSGFDSALSGFESSLLEKGGDQEEAGGLNRELSGVRNSADQAEKKFQSSLDVVGENPESGQAEEIDVSKRLDEMMAEMEGLITGKSGVNRGERRKRMDELKQETDHLRGVAEKQLARKRATMEEDTARLEAESRERIKAMQEQSPKAEIEEAEKEAQRIIDNDPKIKELKEELDRVRLAGAASREVRQDQMSESGQQGRETEDQEMADDPEVQALRAETDRIKAMSTAHEEQHREDMEDLKRQEAEVIKAKLTERLGENPATPEEIVNNALKGAKERKAAAEEEKAEFERQLAEKDREAEEAKRAGNEKLESLKKKSDEIFEMGHELESSRKELELVAAEYQAAHMKFNNSPTEVVRNCQKCGAIIGSNSSRFCSSCGNEVGTVTPEMIRKKYQADLSNLQKLYDKVLQAQGKYDQSQANMRRALSEESKD